MSIISQAATKIVPADLPAPSPDWDFIGTNAGIQIYNGVYTIIIILAGIALLVGVALLVFGKVTQHGGAATAGWWTVGSAIVGAALATGAAVLINWGSNLNLAS